VRYELGFYIHDILHSHRRENLKSYTAMNLLQIRPHKITAVPEIKPMA
jgi:hypothetical protein